MPDGSTYAGRTIPLESAPGFSVTLKDPLIARLKAAGIKVPNQKRARHIMEKMRHGYTPWDRVPAWFLRVREVAQMVFDHLDRLTVGKPWYVKMLVPTLMLEKLRTFSLAEHLIHGHNYGGPMPNEIRDGVLVPVHKALPSVDFEILATYDDPGLVAVDGDDKVLLAVWRRELPGTPVYEVKI